MRFWLVKSILILLLTGSCALHAEQEIKIGWIGPLSGPASFLGVDSVEVARRVFDEANRENAAPGLRFKLVVQDDQYETAKSLTSYAHLVSAEGAKVIFIITYGGNLALAQKAQKDGVLLINPLDCDEELAALPENCFCVAKRSEDLGIENARHILKHKNSPTAILYFNEDPFGPKVAAATKDTLESAGEEVVLYEGVLGSTKDFRPWIIKAKKAGVKSLMVYGYDSFGLAFKQAKEMGLEAAFYSLTNVNSPGFKETAGPAVEGIFASGWFAPRTQAFAKFLEQHKKHVGREPLLEVSTIPTFDLAQLLVAGVKEQGGWSGDIKSVNALRKFLYSIKNYSGLSGDITIDPDGAVRTLKVGMYRYIEGQFTPQ